MVIMMTTEMLSSDFLKLSMQEVADLLLDEYDPVKEYRGVLVDGVDDDGRHYCLSVVLSEKPIKELEFE